MGKRPAQAGNGAVGYVRVSTLEQATEGVSLDAQEARIRAYATMRGLDLVAVVVDAGVSGAKALEDRDGGAAILEALHRGTVAHVVALKLDRLFRDAEDTLHHTKAWDKAGVSLHLLDMGGASIDTSTAMGRMFLTLMAGFAEMERNLTAERTKTALARKAEKGERVGELPYGKMLGADGVHLMDHPAEQAVIATVRELRGTGLSTRAIAGELNRRGVVNRAGGGFNHTQVCRILAGVQAA